MTKILKTRHFGILFDESKSLLSQLEYVDFELNCARSLMLVDADIILVGNHHDLWIGREVIGQDMDYQGHDQICINDFDERESDFLEANLREISSVRSWISERLDEFHKDNCRLKIKNYRDVLAYFF